MTHLLKYLAMLLAFAVAVVLFSSPGAAGLVGGSAYADGGMCYGGSDQRQRRQLGLRRQRVSTDTRLPLRVGGRQFPFCGGRCYVLRLLD